MHRTWGQHVVSMLYDITLFQHLLPHSLKSCDQSCDWVVLKIENKRKRKNKNKIKWKENIKIKSTVNNLDTTHLFVSKRMLITLFWFPIFYSTPFLTLLQTEVLYLKSHSLATHATSICYLWTTLLVLLLMFLLSLPQNVPFWTTYCKLPELHLSQLLMATL